MIAGSQQRIDQMHHAAEGFVQSSGGLVKLVKFGPRHVIEEIGLQTRDPQNLTNREQRRASR